MALKFQFQKLSQLVPLCKFCVLGGQVAPSSEHFQTVPQAYLDAVGMEKVENLVRQRSVGAWFLDHLDNPLKASLPLFPPNIEAST